MTEPFGVEHVKKVCKNILVPTTPKKLVWGFRLNSLDFTSSNAYRWPYPGNWATAAGPFTKSDDPCPPRVGDGICIAKTLTGAQSGGARFGYSIGLLVAYAPADVLAESGDKLRVKRAWVADVFDPVTALRDSRAYLTGANLTRANLFEAYLTRADLTEADLTRANLFEANLTRADLTRANLFEANLTRAKYDSSTRWPKGFDPAARGAVES